MNIKTLLFAAAVAACLNGCAQPSNKSENTMDNNKKTLVAYFSATGTTKRAAEQLAQELGADLYAITPALPYSDADLDWRDKQSRSTLEMNDKSSRPEVQGKIDNLADYDTIWIGFPVWWYTAPTIINTFIEKHDFTGKVLCVFATSGGSGVEGSANDLKKAYPQYKWGESRLLN
ncbi:MAG: NAD(P)H-dependent oxidoreductase [Bacteroidales bacterium]|nr:NAD(P)H-dependent oxidoreductase [Bacteroidales bacterium]